MIWVLLVLYCLIFLTEVFLLIRFQRSFKRPDKFIPPKGVSILVCARNEEENIQECLVGLLSMDYPQSCMQILVGNDQSEDRTEALIDEIISQARVIEKVNVIEAKDGLIAKANVLNQLIEKAIHPFIVIIDADMRPHPKWLSYVMASLQNHEMVSGFTQVFSEPGFLNRLQAADWRIVLHSMKVMADWDKPISMLGNNMGFQRAAYDAVGGFKAQGPTDVEDLALMRQFLRHKFSIKQLVLQSGGAYTKAQKSFSEILIQRCRWMNGVFTHHPLLVFPAFLARFWLVIACTLFFFQPFAGGLVLCYGFLINYIKYAQMHFKIKQEPFRFSGIEPAIISLLDTFAGLRILFRGKVKWKGRQH